MFRFKGNQVMSGISSREYDASTDLDALRSASARPAIRITKCRPAADFGPDQVESKQDMCRQRAGSKDR
jgi:putative component of membrane protein insertase Oxa1/YidC/SpoIIIJ protein YidD